jgi:NADH:ubiquinone oxidoreductase subunit F (NADH-binding)
MTISGIKELSDSNTDGVRMGRTTTAKLGFYGTTPTTIQSVGTAVATTVAISTGTIWGFATSTQANNLTVQVAAIATALKNLGLSS